MANHLKMAKVSTILALHSRGWSNRRIARELGIDRDTVSRHIRAARADASAAKAPTGSEGPADANAARAPTGSADPADPNAAKAPTGSADPTDPNGGEAAAGSLSDCEPHRDLILAKLELGLSAVRIHQDLVEESGDQVPSYYSIRRFVRRFGEAQAERGLPFRRMECEPGAECQVDFGQGAPVVQPNGRRRRPHVLRMVLSHSRKGYSESVFHQSTDNFIRCLENAFWHFGGVPKLLILDNLRAAVSKADWFDPEINPKVQSFCDHYGIVPLPTKPYTPRHKGKIERGIDYVQNNGLKGHVFEHLEAENRHLLNWEASVADTRIHGTTRQQVSKVFDDVERAALMPLPADRFPLFHEAKRSVHRDGHVEVAKAYYSVPPEYVGRRVWVRWDGRVIRIFDGRMVQIAIHAQRQPGQFSTHNQHICSKKISKVERGAAHLLSQTKQIGPQSHRWAQAMLESRGITGVRVLLGLISLTNRYEVADIEHACETAWTHGAYRLRNIRELIKRNAPKQEQFEFLTEHPIIRSLGDYGEMVRTSLQKEPCS